MVKASAPGKLMLFGEHAVIYNKPCIVASVDHRISVWLKKRNDNQIILNAPGINLKNYTVLVDDLNKPYPRKIRFVLVAIKNFFEKYKMKSGLDVETKAEFSSRFGLGSSSAVTVSTIKALFELFGIEAEQREIFNLSYKTVLDVQGLGSGFDVAAAVYGGILFFVTGGKVIKPIEITDIPLVVGYTGVKADTPTLVKMVGRKLLEEPDRINGIFNKIKNIVNLAKTEIENKNWKKVGHLMNLNQDLLRELGVSSKELENLIKAALDSGAYGAKLSGAGGGDCMVVLSTRESLNNIKKAIEKAGGIIIEAKIPAEGVRTE